MKAPREQDLVGPALQLLAAKGVFAWRNNSGGITAFSASGRQRFFRFGGAPGASDILGVLPGGAGHPPGRFLAIELKRPGRRPTPKQQSFLDMVRLQGGAALVIDDLKQLEREIDLLLK
jgi:hypothetical protein